MSDSLESLAQASRSLRFLCARLRKRPDTQRARTLSVSGACAHYPAFAEHLGSGAGSDSPEASCARLKPVTRANCDAVVSTGQACEYITVTKGAPLTSTASKKGAVAGAGAGVPGAASAKRRVTLRASWAATAAGPASGPSLPKLTSPEKASDNRNASEVSRRSAGYDTASPAAPALTAYGTTTTGDNPSSETRSAEKKSAEKRLA